MKYSYLHDVNLAELLVELNREPIYSIWFGAHSFEERCVGSLEFLKSNEIKINKGIALDYKTSVYPYTDAELRRKHNWDIMLKNGDLVFRNGLKRKTVNPYSFHEIQQKLNEEMEDNDVELCIFDITCITKIHALALAAWLTYCSYSFDWILAYTRPENYGDLTTVNGWSDVIVASLSDTALLLNEAKSRGVVIPGHEGNRLITAISELEPSGGRIIMGLTVGRPDFHRLCEGKNRNIINSLIRFRSDEWNIEYIDIDNMRGIESIVDEEITKAKKHKAPIILLPFGPKTMIFMAALQMCASYPESSWFVYPIPIGYNADYSYGKSDVMWFKPRDEK